MATSAGRSDPRYASWAAFNAMILLAGLGGFCNLPAFADNADKSHGADSWGHFLDVTNPYLSAQYTNDSNVLRLDDIQPVTDRADQYVTLAAGFDSDVRSGRQQYQLLGEINTSRYNHHTELNYNGGKAVAAWRWSASDLLTGTVGYRFSRTLRNFENELAPRRDIDIRTENRVFGSADRVLPDNWKLGVRGSFADVAYNHTTSLDIRRTTGGISLAYVSRADNTIGIDLEAIDGSYKTASNQNFTQYTLGPTLEWKYTVRTQLNGTIGYTTRKNSAATRPDYGATTGRIVLTIADAGRGSLTATGWRELSNLGDEIAEYTVINGVSIEPAWTLSNGITIRLKGSYENRDFKVVTGLATDRIDDVAAVSGFLDWPLGRHLKITGGISRGRRSSTRLYQDYEFFQQQLQIVGTL